MYRETTVRSARNRYIYEREMRRRRFRFFLLCIAAIAIIAVVVGVSVSAVKGRDQAAVPEEAPPAATPKPALQIPPASQENDLLQIAIKAQGSKDKICYLTFDDGPTKEVTPSILETLRRYDVKATFFMLGSMIEANPELARQVYDEGHLLANHSYSHEYDDLYATRDSFMKEISQTDAIISGIVGEDHFKLIRFPGGGYNAGSYASAKQEYKKVLQEAGFYYVDWNALNGDAEGGSRSAEQLLARIQETATQDNIVVLMHDAAAKKTTAEALPSVIEYLKGKGYKFRRLDEIKYYDTGQEDPASMIL